MSMKVIAISNFKGGTGKTVTACTLAAVLADQGQRVLLIDADPQHNASDFYGAEADAVTLSHVLAGQAEPYWPDILSPTGREGLSLLPADMDLLTLDLASMRDGQGSEAVKRLRDLMDVLAGDDAFDIVLIDCPPSFTAASVAALAECDDVILPTRADAWSRAGVLEMVEQIRSLRRQTGARPRCLVLITMADRTLLSRQISEQLRECGLTVFDTQIRRSVAVGESSYARQPLMDYAPECNAARDYDALVREYLGEVDDDGKKV